jgi:succinate dehydrogenase / fumarate reductase membrane anchor subunit
VVKRGFTGLPAWLVQRAGAVYMLCFAVFAIAALAAHPVRSYAEWKAWTGSIATSAATGLFVAALLAHLWVGLRDVLLDYAKPARVQRASLLVVAVALVGLALWALRILVRAHL